MLGGVNISQNFDRTDLRIKMSRDFPSAINKTYLFNFRAKYEFEKIFLLFDWPYNKINTECGPFWWQLTQQGRLAKTVMMIVVWSCITLSYTAYTGSYSTLV